MSVQFEFLGPLKQLVNGQDIVEIQAATVGEALDNMKDLYPGISRRLLSDEGLLHQHINLFVNEDDIRYGNDLETRLSAGDKVTVISAIAGG